MKEYKVGDGVWYATYESREVRVPCPVCKGELVVTVILGDGEQVQVECDYCGRGFDGAMGYVVEYVKEPRAEYVTICNRRIEENYGEVKIEYHYNRMGNSYHIAQPNRMFDVEEEALAKAQEMANVVEDKPKYKNEKSYSWNAGYHMKAADRARKEAEYHEAKAKICKSKSKE